MTKTSGPVQTDARVKRRLIVFAKLPIEGQVKTRLAVTIGTTEALRTYVELLQRTLSMAQRVPDTTLEFRFAGEPDEGGARIRELLEGLRSQGWVLTPQRGADLGERMSVALHEALGDGEWPVLIGADCPVFETADMVQAFDALRDHDAVLSPAVDGGYALVGLSRAASSLFEGIEWSTSTVLEQTLLRARNGGFRLRLLREVWDVDTSADFERWAQLRGLAGHVEGT